MSNTRFGTTTPQHFDYLVEFDCAVCTQLQKKGRKKSKNKVTWTTPSGKTYDICLGCHGTITAFNRDGVQEGRFSACLRRMF